MRPVLAALLLAACDAPSTDDAPAETDEAVQPDLPIAYHDPAATGPHTVGITTFLLPEVAGFTDVPVEVWYPASRPSEETTTYDFIGFPFPAAGYRDVPPDPDAPNLLVAFSHGFGGARQQNYTMAERLASHGFVVVAPDHPGTTTLDFLATFGDIGPALVRRPATLRAAVDAVIGGAVPGLDLAPDTYGVIGHSLGAWTALAVGGGALSSEAYEAACSADPKPDGCNIIGDTSYSDEDVATFAQPDPRVVTTILQAPGGAYSFDAATLANLERPFVMGGVLDDLLSYDDEIAATYTLLGPPAALARFEGAGHFGYTNMCDLAIATVFATDCGGVEAGFADPDVVLQVTTRYVVAWMGAVLGEQEAYQDHLGEDEGVGWQEK